MTGQKLWNAAGDGDAEKVHTLLSTQGAQSFINYQDSHGCTPLHIASAKGQKAVTKQLIAARCNVDLQDKYGMTPLLLAAIKGHEAAMKQLIDARCNVDLQDARGYTALTRDVDCDSAHDATSLSLPVDAFVMVGSM